MQTVIPLCNYVQLVSTTVTRNKLESLRTGFLPGSTFGFGVSHHI